MLSNGAAPYDFTVNDVRYEHRLSVVVRDTFAAKCDIVDRQLTDRVDHPSARAIRNWLLEAVRLFSIVPNVRVLGLVAEFWWEF